MAAEPNLPCRPGLCRTSRLLIGILIVCACYALALWFWPRRALIALVAAYVLCAIVLVVLYLIEVRRRAGE